MSRSVKLLCLAGLLTLAAGCSGKTMDSVNDTTDTTPVKLTMYVDWAALTDEEFEKYFKTPVSKKYPNVTMEIMRNSKGSTPEELLASGEFPDLIYTSNPGMPNFKLLGLPEDLNELVKKQKMDLTRFQQRTLDAIKLFSEKGELYAIPFSENYSMMLYNKDIFNKFGVPYPKEGMDWEQTVDLAKKVTRSSEGNVYLGLDQGTMVSMATTLSLPYVDPKTEKALVGTEPWAKLFRQIQDFYSIPGVLDAQNKKIPANFHKTQNVAMLVGWLDEITGNRETLAAMNWDITTAPNTKADVGKGREVDTHLLMVSKLGKQKEWAFRAISVVTNDETQSEITKNGRMSALNKPEIQKMYGVNLSHLKDKNTAAIFKVSPRAPHFPTVYDQQVKNVVNGAGKYFTTEKTDLNTMLRKLEEDANKAIENSKIKK